MAEATMTTLVTGIKFAQNALTAVNAMTFLTDDTWVAGESEASSLPVAFFMVVGQHELMSSEVSKKTLIFSDDGATGTDGSNAITNVVADNIVLQPKQWKLDILIPYGTKLSPFASYPALHLGQTSGVLSGMAQGSGWKNFWSVTSTLLAGAQTIIDSASLMFSSISAAAGTGVSELLSVPDYNKRSLEAMWRKRGVYRMKLWNSWRSVYVAITNLDVHKEPTEDNIYRASMTVQEMPMLNYGGMRGALSQAWNNPYLEAAGRLMLSIVNNVLPLDADSVNMEVS